MKAILITILLIILAATPIDTLLLYNFFVQQKLVGDLAFTSLMFSASQVLTTLAALMMVMLHEPKKQNPG